MATLRAPSPKPEFLEGGSARLEDTSGFQIGPRANAPKVNRLLTVLPLNKSYVNQIIRTEAISQHTLVVDTSSNVIGKVQSVFVHRMLRATDT
jgi:hypothetical protein